MSGVLYIVATPIGHLKDITYRAIETLNNVAIIAAEDTRHSRQLLSHYDINTKLISLHDHNEAEQVNRILHMLAAGQSIALISDAGTPLISDPGYHLVNAVRHAGFNVLTVPGCSAVIAALSIAGLPTDQFYFRGFLPAKGEKRTNMLAAVLEREETCVLYESPKRIVNLLTSLAALAPMREVVLARELTKQFETVLTGFPNDLLQEVQQDPNQQKGEFVVLIAGKQHDVGAAEIDRVFNLLLEHCSAKNAAKLTADILGVKPNLVKSRYQR